MTTPADTALQDQVDAATTDAGSQMELLVTALHGTIFHNVQPPPWMTAAIDRHNTIVVTTGLVECRHLSTPRPRYLAVWRPGFAACERCLFALRPDPGNEWVCDGCSVEHVGGIALSTAHIGTAILMYGLCRGCRADVV